MILYRRFGVLYEQEELAEYFWVKIGVREVSSFLREFPLLSSMNLDEWVETMKIEGKLREFMIEHEHSCEIETFSIERIDDLDLFIREHLSSGYDIWCEYIRGDITDITKTSPLGIHDGLITAYDTETHFITLMNPEPKQKNRITFPIEELRERMSGRHGRPTWCIIIR